VIAGAKQEYLEEGYPIPVALDLVEVSRKTEASNHKDYHWWAAGVMSLGTAVVEHWRVVVDRNRSSSVEVGAMMLY
jgi:hypothetical protein